MKFRNKIYPAFLFPFSICFEQKYEKYQNSLPENIHFLVVKFSVYLNRHIRNVFFFFFFFIIITLSEGM